MSSLLPFIIAGLTTGSVYGLAGVGLVLTYKTSKVFNFAHGSLATISAFMFYSLHVSHHLPWPLAAVICLVVAGPVLGMVFELLARALGKAALTVRVAGTVGILLMVSAAIGLIYGTTATYTVPSFLGSGTVHIGPTAITQSQMMTWLIGIVATAGLYVYFRVSRSGVAMRAVVDDPDLLDLAGMSPRRVRRFSWAIGVTFAALSGLLLAPVVNLDPNTLTLLVVQAFGAAALGRFANMPATYVGGLVIGVAAALSTKFFTHGLLSQLPPAMPFLILFVVLLTASKRRLAEKPFRGPRGGLGWTAPLPVQLAGGVVLLIVLALVPRFADVHLTDWTMFLAGTITLLSLGLLVRTSGQVSLCQVSFVAIGSAAYCHLASGAGVPWFFAVVLAGLIAVPIGALLAIPAIRLSGLYLALATFGFGILLSYMFYSQKYMFGTSGLGLTAPRPHLSWITLDTDEGYYYVLLVALAISAVFVMALVRSRLGRLLGALADSPEGLATAGASVQVTRIVVFCVSAFLAAVAGALGAGALTNVNSDSYQPLMSLTYFALVIIVVGNAPWYAVLAAAGMFLIPSYLTSANTTLWLQLLFGVSAVGYALTPDRLRQIPAPVTQALDRLRWRRRGHADTAATPAPAMVPATELGVRDLRVAFGGLVAVDGVNLRARSGRITALIGPNGAGKTTTFNACSGLNRPSAGRIVLGDRDLTRSGPAVRARRGLGRSFQQMELYESMTVRQNVELGAEARFATMNVLGHLIATPAQRAQIEAAARNALQRCGVVELADRQVAALSTGQRRLVELARCLAGSYQLLLLDEPSSGLDRHETDEFGRILQAVVADRGIGVLLVEHDMHLVTEVCDYIYVLDFGKLIFEGTPREVIDSPLVQAAYLGTDADGEIESAAGEAVMS